MVSRDFRVFFCIHVSHIYGTIYLFVFLYAELLKRSFSSVDDNTYISIHNGFLIVSLGRRALWSQLEGFSLFLRGRSSVESLLDLLVGNQREKKEGALQQVSSDRLPGAIKVGENMHGARNP